jgi:protein O-GlcNAc transferase
MSRVIDVFLSSTAQDLVEHRKAVHERLGRTGLFRCIRQEDFGAQDAGAVDFCRRKSQEAGMFVGLIGMRRGWEPDGDYEKRSITEMEYDWARDAGRPRYLWVMPEDFPLPANKRESSAAFKRQMAFRKRVMGGGRIVSQKGFGSPELLAAEIVEQLLLNEVVAKLQEQARPEAAALGQPALSKEEQAPAIFAAFERLAEDKDVDLLALAKDPKGIDVAELEAKLMAREKELEAEARQTAKKRAEYWRHIGALAFLNDTQKALAAYEKATALDPDDPEGWRYLGELHFRLGDLNAAREALVVLQALGERASDLQTQSLVCLRLNWIENSSGNLDEAERLADQARQLAHDAQWSEGVAHAYRNLGLIFYTRGDLDRAEDMQLKSLKLDEEQGRKEGMADASGNLGAIYFTRGDLDRAEDMQLKSLKLEEELGRKEGMAISYGNLGAIYITRGDLDRAEDMQLEALNLNEELGRKVGMAACYGNLGLIYETRGDLDRAEDMQLKTLKLYEELGGKWGMARAYGNLGNSYFTRGNLDRAEQMQLKALKLDEELGGKEGMAASYGSLGNIYFTQGNLDRAEEMQLNALRLAAELGGKEGLAITYGNLGVIYQAREEKAKMCECWCKERDLRREMGLEDKAAEAEKWLRLNGCGEE